MNISIFDLFSIGIGPSSSHTVGPMRAANDFVMRLAAQSEQLSRIEVILYGSLAYTGPGHGTDKAILGGLCGFQPETVDPELAKKNVDAIKNTHAITLPFEKTIAFDLNCDYIARKGEQLDYHSNAMRFSAYDDAGATLATEVYYSLGGGFIITNTLLAENKTFDPKAAVPYAFSTAEELLALCEEHQMSIAELILANEYTWHKPEVVEQKINAIINAMEDCIDRGCNTSGTLEGGLNVRRRAPALYRHVLELGPPGPNHPQTMNWLNTFALAVNEENAAGGRVVTAPTNGASGIIPAIIRYYKQFCRNVSPDGPKKILLTAGAIGLLYKKNASISGAEMGCQGEVGVACSMAAAGLASALGGTIYQVENAAEIGMEHNLGITCDPVGGLVQIPCIERNAMGAVKAVNAARLAMAEEGQHKVSLDMVINTMREIGENMNSIYKETSQGGLAVNVVEC